MADQSDVENALAALIAGTLYPEGTDAPSILNTVCRVYRGWPHSGSLDEDLKLGHVNVTVFPEPRHQLVTTRYPAEPQVIIVYPTTYTISTTATSATIGGTAGANQLVGLLVDKVAVVHRTAATDTPELVAAILCADLATQRLALVSGATITVPGALRIIGRVVADQVTQAEIRRQRQLFRISLWCPDPAIRDAAGTAIDAALAATDFLTLADGTSGRLLFHGSALLDHAENAALYRRDLHYSVEYATTLTTTLPSMIFGDAGLSGNGIPHACGCIG